MIRVRDREHCRHLLRLTLVTLFMGAALHAWSDHALLQDGRGLFNVIVDDTNTTWSRPLRVRYNQQSFGYDYGKHTVFVLPGHYGSYYDIADFVQTTETVGKSGARQLMAEKGWNHHRPPPRVRLFPVIPAPPTPVATPAPPVEAADPMELADPGLPLDQRLEAQLNLFIQAQTDMSSKIKFSVAVHSIDEETGKKFRIELLQHQLKVLTSYYPLAENRVQKARQALEHQIEVVKKTGKFSHED